MKTRQSRSRYIGQTFGTLKIIEELDRRGAGGVRILWRAHCSKCGSKRETLWSTAVFRKSIRCQRCRKLERKHPLYGYWGKLRNYAKVHSIPFFDGWRSFETFVNAVGPRPRGTSLLRIIHSEGFVPGNVTWSERRGMLGVRHRAVSIYGIVLSVALWGEVCGVTRERMRQRLNKRSAEEAVGIYPSAIKFFAEHGIKAKVFPVLVGGGRRRPRHKDAGAGIAKP